MAQNKVQELIDHLDKSLLGKGSIELDLMIGNDRELAGEWNYLQLAVATIQDAGLHEQVLAVRKKWSNQQSVDTQFKTPVFNMYRKAMRIAAFLLVLAGSAAIYKYNSTSSDGLYNQYYASYDLSTNRAAGVQDALELAYNNKNWAEVITLFNTANERSHKLYFLAGMADLELKIYGGAIEKFQQIVAENAQSHTDYFQDEAEYYLAMSLLASNKADQAMPILEKIKADKGHLYHQIVTKMSFTDLNIVQFKDRK
ncbi:MAG TPA: hypothetical protein VK563_14795 [Puia sp.]|nr:hypothetical protein [Puia sp.]